MTTTPKAADLDEQARRTYVPAPHHDKAASGDAAQSRPDASPEHATDAPMVDDAAGSDDEDVAAEAPPPSRRGR